ncbi:conserved hypothetical protein [Culex quinquefasciatus]|uniref:FMN hydroxy acid dehydrogenase domain-containing protein n=1 Tax=Culex quinquefasciatus TaxID=7176 RepID=B0X406_CULQU|nr:conserved hypothetical protein [Culex quinquefasciatus]|eukprot:XP_001864378.1 conserved hypothetical protein [Culex quinquefasciatus]
MVNQVSNPILPFGIAPTSADRRVNSAVEIASLKVAEKLKIPFVLNLLSSITIEEAAEISPNASKWLEIYPFKDHRITEVLVQKVEKSNFSGIMVSTNESETSFFPSIEGIEMGYKPAVIHDLLELGLLKSNSSEKIYDRDSNEFWSYTKWLTGIAKHPIILKGNFNECDVIRAVESQISGFCLTDPSFQEIKAMQASIGKQTPLIVSGDVICEKLSAEYLKHGVDLVLIERATQWGFTINRQRGIEDVVRLYENAIK